MVMLSLSLVHAVTQDEVIIGLNVPLSGPYVLQGKDQLNSYALAKEEIDAAGGILGKKIKFLIADSKSDPKVSVENVKKFIAEGVDMVNGGSSSGVAVALSALCHQQKKLFMATLTYSNDTTGKDAHRHTFRETYNAWMGAVALGRYLKKNFPNKKYFYVTSDYTWGWTTRDSMKRFTGSEAATDVLIKLGTPIDSPLYRDAVRKAIDEKAEVIVLVLFGRDMMAGVQSPSREELDALLAWFSVCKASEHETHHFQELLSKYTEAVYADQGYVGNRDRMQSKGIRDGIQSKATRGRPLSFADTLRNQRITRKRRIVEGVFGSWKRWCGWRKTRFIGLARNELAVCLTALAWNLKKWEKLSTPRWSYA